MKIQDVLNVSNIGKTYEVDTMNFKGEFYIIEPGEGCLDLVLDNPQRPNQSITEIFYLNEILNMEFKEKESLIR